MKIKKRCGRYYCTYFQSDDNFNCTKELNSNSNICAINDCLDYFPEEEKTPEERFKERFIGQWPEEITKKGNPFSPGHGLNCPERIKTMKTMTIEQLEKKSAEYALLRLAVEYLEHPDVQAINFAMPSRIVAKRIRRLLESEE